MIGRARPELRSDLRSFPYGAYLILYRDAARRGDRAGGARRAQSRGPDLKAGASAAGTGRGAPGAGAGHVLNCGPDPSRNTGDDGSSRRKPQWQ